MKTVSALSFAALMAFSNLSFSGEISCDDLDSMATVLDELAVALEDAENIREGSQADQALGQLIDNLEVVAEVEGNRQLHNQVQGMASAWHEMDGERFMDHLDGVIETMDALYKRDCE